ncbi:hypothetical protein AXE65_10645 [Ventosimonas gracilis]|uniref:Uncharacterized protein n=1 Tax=Ventosimonas gracilis TaxID=1680762 RepID=A0A139SWS2_9GAMM|nr:MucB/RseB C-terminal domain-containing protein [Ventosimonas gracilis]KXU39049.1 hypothetical protein AXE65_10645 [Ventosimonas gracilis]
MRYLLLLVCLLPLKLLAITPLSPVDVLRRMQSAYEQQSFQGSFSYQRGGDFSTYRIWHQAEAGVVHERLLRLDGAVQEILREGDTTRCASAALQEALPLARHARQPLDLDRLRSVYDFGFTLSRVAGRETFALQLIPRDRDRYAMELYVDSKTHVLLKTVLLGEQGQTLESLQFLDFSPGSLPADALTPSSACLPATAQSIETAQPEPAGSWQLSYLPDGFRLLQVQKHESSKVTQLTYGDGLARFSVFIEPLNAQWREIPSRLFGSTALVSSRRRFAAADWMVTVVGEIPPSTAMMIASFITDAAR